MKNKLFWPIVVLSMVIMIESVLLMSDGKNPKGNNILSEIPLAGEERTESIIDFSWSNEEINKPILIMTANDRVAIDAIDLYIAYNGLIVNSVSNLNELPEPTFSKVSSEKSLVVMNYLISNENGFVVEKNQSIKVAQLEINLDPSKTADLSIDPKTQVVENATVRVLPFNDTSLVIKGDSL